MIQDLEASVRAYMKAKPDGGFYVDVKNVPADVLRALHEADDEYREIEGEPLLEFRE